MIKIIVPFYNHINDETTESMKRLSPDLYTIQSVQGTYIGDSRDFGVLTESLSATRESNQILNGKYSHFLFVDADMFFNPQDITALVEHDLPVVSGAYCLSTTEKLWCAGKIIDRWIYACHKSSVLSLEQCDFCGGGFLLVKAEVFEKVPRPWFRYIMDYYDVDGEPYSVQWKEDIGFCMHLVKHGYKIMVDFNTVIGHCNKIHRVHDSIDLSHVNLNQGPLINLGRKD